MRAFTKNIVKKCPAAASLLAWPKPTGGREQIPAPSFFMNLKNYIAGDPEPGKYLYLNVSEHYFFPFNMIKKIIYKVKKIGSGLIKDRSFFIIEMIRKRSRIEGHPADHKDHKGSVMFYEQKCRKTQKSP